jgi:hypothetical protein
MKWADYAITAVRYNQQQTHIEQLQVREVMDSYLGSPNIKTRSEVIASIKRQFTYVTALKKLDKWEKGEDVRIITVSNVEYLRTDNNSRESDNLGELPEF